MATVYGWVTEAEADAFMTTRWKAADVWVSGVDKPAALTTAYNMLIACGLFTFPSTASQAMKDAQCEQALFLVQQGAALDARIGVRAQGVTQAGVVKETYKDEEVEIPISPMAKALLSDYQTTFGDGYLNIMPVTRDREEEDVL